jgi:hypothetical protein
VPEVLARVTPRTLDVPRGPDVVHRIRVPRAWLESGEMVEFEVPRNLSCATCDGGGCDSCERAGAITLRGRNELPEIITVTLPARKVEANAEVRGVVIRIPEQGGLPAVEDAGLPRGMLLLRVEPAEVGDPGVALVVQPEAPVSEERVALSLRVPKPTPKQAWMIAVVLAIVVLAGLAILAFRQHRS